MNNVTRCNRVRRMGGVAALVTWLVWGLGCGQAFDREAVLVEARKAGQRKDYREAVRLLREVLAHVPHDAETRYDLGQTLLRSGRPFQARLQFFQTVQLDSTHRDALRHLGLLAYQAGDQTEALEMLERAVRAGVREAHIHDKLGILYSEAGWVEEAKAQIREVLRLHPGQLRNRLNLATLNQETGAYDNARQELEGIVADFPNNWDAHFSLGKVYRELGQSEAAVLSLEWALVLKPNDAEIHYQLGAARLQAGHLEGARSASQDAIRLSPNHAGAHYCLGQTYTRMGRPEKAKVALARFRGTAAGKGRGGGTAQDLSELLAKGDGEGCGGGLHCGGGIAPEGLADLSQRSVYPHSPLAGLPQAAQGEKGGGDVPYHPESVEREASGGCVHETWCLAHTQGCEREGGGGTRRSSGPEIPGSNGRATIWWCSITGWGKPTGKRRTPKLWKSAQLSDRGLSDPAGYRRV